jgi:hypothetical protein
MGINLTNTRIKILIVGVVAFTPIMASLMARTDVPPVATAATTVDQGRPFDESWRHAAVTVALKSQARVIPEPEIKEVKTEVILPTAIATPEEITPKIRAKLMPEETNICTRHHMHKVSIRHGRSWRCRKWS